MCPNVIGNQRLQSCPRGLGALVASSEWPGSGCLGRPKLQYLSCVHVSNTDLLTRGSFPQSSGHRSPRKHDLILIACMAFSDFASAGSGTTSSSVAASSSSPSSQGSPSIASSSASVPYKGEVENKLLAKAPFRGVVSMPMTSKRRLRFASRGRCGLRATCPKMVTSRRRTHASILMLSP